jgi:acetyl-CoA acetyltransferase
MTDIAVVGYAQSPPAFGVQETETQMLFPAVNEALARANLTRKDIGFTCSATCDYLSGAPFAFVQTLEVTGAWPPISESHVEMDGAWALYEAWVRLHHGDIDTAMVFASGITSRCNWREVSSLQLDPYYLMPLWLDDISAAALQAQALIESGKATEKDIAAVTARVRGKTVDEVLSEPYLVEPLRAEDTPTMSDGGAAVILAAGDKARALCDRPAWIAGIDHRSDAHYLGARDLTVSNAARIAGEQAGVAKGPVEVAEMAAQFSHEELVLREALGLGDEVVVSPSGGAMAANPIIATGLIRIGEAANQIIDGGRNRVLAHASAGPCLQQNLVCVLEGD